MSKVTIARRPDHPAETWWTAARAANVPRELAPLVAGDAEQIQTTGPRARELRAWCAGLSGWAEEPLLFRGLRGRSPTSGRRVGGVQVSFRLSADEHNRLEALASRREQSLADLLRTAALAEVARSAATDAVAAADIEPATVEMLEVGDLVHAGLAPVVPALRVREIVRNGSVWRVELAGEVLQLATNATVWRVRETADRDT